MQRWLCGRVVVLVAPLLFESGPLLPLLCSPVYMVDAPEEAQVARLIARDGVSKEEAVASLAAQLGREKKAALSSAVIRNDGTRGGEFSAAALALAHFSDVADAGRVI